MVNFFNSNLGSLMMSQNKALITYRQSVTPNTTNTMRSAWRTHHQQEVISEEEFVVQENSQEDGASYEEEPQQNSQSRSLTLTHTAIPFNPIPDFGVVLIPVVPDTPEEGADCNGLQNICKCDAVPNLYWVAIQNRIVCNICSQALY
ncbi:hypothetical protein Pcinc_039488 [Petrolisthes cinctipes]|uniref:Uncharacterized protein n=1 Tax=Petrolisthes cinctipes TaxID=88211 RepID=A0AAE1BNW1_PETCI|nr:hypothetical protein Pcinc_039488 [Petrolisthes cinctipes]